MYFNLFCYVWHFENKEKDPLPSFLIWTVSVIVAIVPPSVLGCLPSTSLCWEGTYDVWMKDLTCFLPVFYLSPSGRKGLEHVVYVIDTEHTF